VRREAGEAARRKAGLGVWKHEDTGYWIRGGWRFGRVVSRGTKGRPYSLEKILLIAGGRKCLMLREPPVGLFLALQAHHREGSNGPDASDRPTGTPALKRGGRQHWKKEAGGAEARRNESGLESINSSGGRSARLHRADCCAYTSRGHDTQQGMTSFGTSSGYLEGVERVLEIHDVFVHLNLHSEHMVRVIVVRGSIRILPAGGVAPELCGICSPDLGCVYRSGHSGSWSLHQMQRPMGLLECQACPRVSWALNECKTARVPR
jgi:hypothetical protein